MLIIGFNLKEFFSGSLKVENLGREQIDKKSGCNKSIIPKLEWHRSIGK
jgi:hypothetical protein